MDSRGNASGSGQHGGPHPASGGAPDAGGALREGEVAGLTPEDIDFDAANGMGTFTVNRSMQRVQKDTLAQVDKGCILRIFPDKLEGSKTSLILKDTKTEASCRTIFMTAALREELKQWLERLKREEAIDPERYRNSGMLLRLPNGLAVEPVLIRKKFLKWQDAHPEFPASCSTACGIPVRPIS